MISWGGLGCCIIAAAIYLVGKSSERTIEALKSVTRVNLLKDLSVLLDTARKGLPLVVSVYGQVFSETPIHCELSDLRGVIVKVKAERHFLKQTNTGSWIRDSVLMLSTSKEVPWCLDDGTGRAFVVDALDATDRALTVTSEMFPEPESLLHVKMLGVRRTERVLPMGTLLTVVGEAIKDDIGTIHIQRPSFVTPKNLDQLISDFVSFASLCQFASIGFALFGVFLLGKSECTAA